MVYWGKFLRKLNTTRVLLTKGDTGKTVFFHMDTSHQKRLSISMDKIYRPLKILALKHFKYFEGCHCTEKGGFVRSSVVDP
jgi:hypothetical protein